MESEFASSSSSTIVRTVVSESGGASGGSATTSKAAPNPQLPRTAVSGSETLPTSAPVESALNASSSGLEPHLNDGDDGGGGGGANASTASDDIIANDTQELTISENNPSASSSAGHSNSSAPTNPAGKEEKRVGCAHYKRRTKFVTPCCNKLYMCRYCHDEVETHYFNRKTVTQIICTECDTRQKVQANCEKCGVRFGKYTCLICNLFDDEDKDQYHCEGCGICRVGGKDRFFHCEVCNMCLPLQLKIDGHRCVENVSRSNCPVCLEDIHTSRIPCHIPDCGHLIHRTCFEELLSSGHYACPTCQTSMIDMKKLWDYLDTEVENSPMPKEYENYVVDILCKDCHKESNIPYHVVGLKCAHCGAYNTCRTKKATVANSGKPEGSSSSH